MIEVCGYQMWWYKYSEEEKILDGGVQDGVAVISMGVGAVGREAVTNKAIKT